MLKFEPSYVGSYRGRIFKTRSKELLAALTARLWQRVLGPPGFGFFNRASQFNKQLLLFPQHLKHLRRAVCGLACQARAGGLTSSKIQTEDDQPNGGQTGPGLWVRPEQPCK